MAENPLGKSTAYVSEYSPGLLYPIARNDKRQELNALFLKFSGVDIWNAYELSWLNPKGLPQVALGEIRIAADTPNIIESKSLKLYLNSLNQTRFDSWQKVQDVIVKDLSEAAQGSVELKLYRPEEADELQVEKLCGELLDSQDIEVGCYEYSPELLTAAIGTPPVEEILVSHLLKSNCLITNQPDWASVQIRYQGPKIDREALLRYIISFRSHNEFHEQCVERMFCDLKQYCRPQKLSIYARYTRRGGLDINPYRSDFSDIENEDKVANTRLIRQ
ncbi:NADPH-dependent 7-cyano-7-deazaguanine reductase QueF [Aliikangiella sp. G2MR2-5]|uniref:NADPH-dependent 7-cyano-7-deazaguanine reductase QueF n=1 Tax=Aliikangiella sp. G2MR2-5 TaxID=2788943 RepID=UPI0018AC5F16|nr:NADPH-dependent 7-cyano-7-deazaguanine reductase QueF [Aliikangiella sp. G2MR2-5]